MKKVEFEDQLPFYSHMEELRTRLLYILITSLIGFFICYGFKSYLLIILKYPLPAEFKNLTFLAPTEAFVTVVKVSFFSGLILSLPVIFYHIWCFSCPALKKTEKLYFLVIVFASCLFFIIGVLFAFFVVMPLGLDFLINYGKEFGTPGITISNYLSFAIKFIMAFGIIFELPLVVTILTKLGIINSNTLKRNRSICIVSIFVISAILTPPDIATQVLMSVPLIILFELSIVLAKLFEKKENENEN